MSIIYLKGRFNTSCNILDLIVLRKNPLSVRVLLSVKDLENLYNEANRYQPIIQNTDNPISTKIQTDKNSQKVVLYLNSIGDLWQESKTKLRYTIGEGSNRYKIVRYLAGNLNYHQTPSIALTLEVKNEEYVRGEVRKINNRAKVCLKLGSSKLIMGRKGSGYRINPNYKIKVVST